MLPDGLGGIGALIQAFILVIRSIFNGALSLGDLLGLIDGA
jgi:hypothetical protein